MNKFWVVRDPTPNSTPEEVLMEFTATDHAKYVIGCGLEVYTREHHEVHATREAAVADADARVAKAVAKLNSLRTGSGPSTVALWANLRGRVSLPEVVGMVRQNLDSCVGDTDEALGLANRLIAAIERLGRV
jgi:hypothetical protein